MMKSRVITVEMLRDYLNKLIEQGHGDMPIKYDSMDLDGYIDLVDDETLGRYLNIGL